MTLVARSTGSHDIIRAREFYCEFAVRAPARESCFIPCVKKGPGNKTVKHVKTNAPCSRSVLPSGQKKKQMPSEKKMSHKGQIPLIARLHSARRQLFPPWPPSRPGSAQEIVLPSFKKEKQAQKNEPVKHGKTFPSLCFPCFLRTAN